MITELVSWMITAILQFSAWTASLWHRSMIPRVRNRLKSLTGEAKSLLPHPSPSERRKLFSYLRNPGRDCSRKENLMRNLSTHSAPRSIGNMTWRDRKAMTQFQHSKVDRKHNLSPAELALAFFSKVEKVRSRRKPSHESPCYCAACWSQSLPVTSPRKKHFSSRQSISSASSCSEILSQTSSCTGKSWQSEPPMPPLRRRYSLTRRTNRPQCCCGSHGKGCAKDCEFCCALNCARVQVSNSKEAGLEALSSSYIGGKNEPHSTSHCELQGLKIDGNSCICSSEKIILSNTKSTGVCTESESRRNMLRRSDRAVMTDERHDCLLEIVGHNSKGSFKENCTEKAIYKAKATPFRQDVRDKVLIGKTRDLNKHDVHDAATCNVRDISRRIYHDKAVGSDKEITRHDYHDDLQRANANNVSRHNIHQDKALGSSREISKHVFYEKDVENWGGNSKDRNVLNDDEKSRADGDLKATSHPRDHSTDRGVRSEMARNKTRDKIENKTRERANDKPKINVEDCIRGEVTHSSRFTTHDYSDSGSCKAVKNRCKTKKDICSAKNSDCSKMSFVLGDKPRHFPTGVSDRSITTDTSNSIRDSTRRRAHVSRKK